MTEETQAGEIETIAIDKADWDLLMKMNSELLALDKVVERFIRTAQARQYEINEQLRKIWTDLADKYKLDIKSFAYAPDIDKPQLQKIGVIDQG